MRLFIAVEFPPSFRRAWQRGAEAVRSRCVRGSFPPEGNLHMTLCFLGETPPERVNEVIAAMDRTDSPPIPLTAGPLGRFRSRGGDTVYRAVEAGEELYRLQRTLASELAKRGFSLEERAFTPHLTVARRAVLSEGASLRGLSSELPPLCCTAREIALLRSDLIGGRRVYTRLYAKALDAEATHSTP